MPLVNCLMLLRIVALRQCPSIPERQEWRSDCSESAHLIRQPG
jgi:hypothetical protein